MYRFFVRPGNICGNDIYIEGQDFNHIKNVLRMRVGEELSVVAEEDTGMEGYAGAESGENAKSVGGKEYRCEIADYEEDRVHLKGFQNLQLKRIRKIMLNSRTGYTSCRVCQRAIRWNLSYRRRSNWEYLR